MLLILAVLGLTLGATAIQLAPEVAGEAIAMYIVEPPADGSFGASLNKQKKPVLASNSTSSGEYAGPVFSESQPVMATALGTAEPAAWANTPTEKGASDPTPAQFADSAGADKAPEADPLVSRDGEHQGTELDAPDEEVSTLALASAAPTLSSLQLSLMREKPKVNPDGTIFLPIASQRAFGVRTVAGQLRNVPLGIELPGRVIVNPASNILVQATYRGFLETANGHFPFVGQRVSKGQLLAKLKPINNHLDEAQVRERITELTNEIELARKRMAMLNEVVYVRYRVNKIEEIRTEIQGLVRRLAVLEESLNQSYDLRARTDGVVSEVGASAGQHVEEGTTLFRIVDPQMLWVEASGYAQGLQSSIRSANALTLDGSSLDLAFVGGGLSLNNQAIPLLFEVLSTDAQALSIGNPVTVFVRTEESEVSGIVVPRSSIVRDTDGTALVWKKLSAEIFLKTQVSVVPIDAKTVLVTGNLAPNDRVVSAGVGLLAQIR